MPQLTQAAKTSAGTCQELRLKICACLIQKQLFWISSWRLPTSCLFCAAAITPEALPPLLLLCQSKHSPAPAAAFPSPLPCWQTIQNLTSYSQPSWAAYNLFLFLFSTSAVLNIVCCWETIKQQINCTFLIPAKRETPGTRDEWFLRQNQQSVPKIKGRVKYS